METTLRTKTRKNKIRMRMTSWTTKGLKLMIKRVLRTVPKRRRAAVKKNKMRKRKRKPKKRKSKKRRKSANHKR